MKVYSRYYIETKDGLFFASNSDVHPKSHYVAFLRYIPCEDGDRIIGNVKYKKVNSDEAYSFLKKYHPEYLFEWNITNKKMMGVIKEDVVRVYDPRDRIKHIRKNNKSSILYEKITLLTDVFHESCNINYDDMGVTGSCLIGLENETSDIDFIIYGIENHRKVIEAFSRLKYDDDSILEAINDDYWEFVYDKRIKDNSMSLNEFKWYESRKNNRGIIKGTLFDILLNKKEDEIDLNNNVKITQLEKVKIKCEVCDDSLSYDTPATYNVKNVEFLEGTPKNIESICSFTHTYTGIVKNKEKIIASGVCEKYQGKGSDKISYKLIIGTTRESINEYIKLEKNPIKKMKL